MTDVLNEVHTPQTVIRLIKHMRCQKCHFWAQYFWAQKGVLETKIIILEGNCNILVCADIRVFGYVKWLLLRQTSNLVQNRIGKLVVKKNPTLLDTPFRLL